MVLRKRESRSPPVFIIILRGSLSYDKEPFFVGRVRGGIDPLIIKIRKQVKEYLLPPLNYFTVYLELLN